MSKFKVGDKVSFRNDPLRAYIVTATNNYYIEIRAHESRASFDFPVNASELVLYGRKDEIDQLVEQANEALKIIHTANEHSEIESRKGGLKPTTKDAWLTTYFSEYVFGRKLKTPIFEPFTVGTKWKVELVEKELKVGCLNLNPNELRQALADLCAGDNGTHVISGLKLAHNRKGIWTQHGSITWDDADKILVALQNSGY